MPGATFTVRIDVDVETLEIPELYLQRGFLQSIDKGYQDDGLDTPDYIIDRLNAVNFEITNRNRAELERQLKAAEARLQGLKSREEKATELKDTVAKLKEKLGKKQ